MELQRNFTHHSQTPPPNLRPQSPLGLARHSRMVEKAELANLNDRLASYIDRVRFLENENSRLGHEVQMIVESHTREKSNIKRMYESEFGNVRKALDESAKERTRIEIEAKRLHEENANLKNHLQKKTKELNEARTFEPKYNDLLAKYNSIDADQKKALDTNNELEEQIANLNSALNDMRRHLEEETLARVEVENKAQSLREELAFNSQLDQDMPVQAYSMPTDIHKSTDDGAKLERSLRQLRDQYEVLMRANREEIDTLYKAKLENLQSEADRANTSAASAIEEIRNAGYQISSLNAKISELDGQAHSYLARIRDLEALLDNSIRQRGDDQAAIQSLRDEMSQQAQEYQDLMDIKVSLDLEIAAYNELLSSEEERLQSSHTADLESAEHFKRPTSDDHEVIPQKRRRTSSNIEMDHIQTTAAKHNLEIQHSCPDGKFVSIVNNGDSEIAIGGWQLKRVVGENETVFKFRRSSVIEPKGTVTVWSANAEAQHEAPANIVMRKNWIPGEISKTQLFNGHRKEMANLERIQNELDTDDIKIE